LKAFDKPQRKRLNLAERRALKVASAADFMRKYQRRAQKRVEPNDRRHDIDVEKAVQRMNPVELDRLLRDDESG